MKTRLSKKTAAQIERLTALDYISWLPACTSKQAHCAHEKLRDLLDEVPEEQQVAADKYAEQAFDRLNDLVLATIKKAYGIR